MAIERWQKQIQQEEARLGELRAALASHQENVANHPIVVATADAAIEQAKAEHQAAQTRHDDLLKRLGPHRQREERYQRAIAHSRQSIAKHASQVETARAYRGSLDDEWAHYHRTIPDHEQAIIDAQANIAALTEMIAKGEAELTTAS
jgi:chromosome segregation ATPase